MGYVTGPLMMHDLPPAPAGWCWEYKDGEWRLVPTGR